MRRCVALLVASLLISASLAQAATDHKPRRGKHYIPADKVGSVTTEDLNEEKVEEKGSFIDRVKKDSRLTAWIDWWKGCDRSFSMDALTDAGVVTIGGEWGSFNPDEMKGPNRDFLERRGGMAFNPVWGRMTYVKNDKIWHARMENSRCGVMLYQKDRARRIIECGELDGVFGGFWVDGNKAVITAYRKMSPEMNAECQAKEVGQCVAPILWLVDLADDSVWEYRGPVVTFTRCEPNDFLVRSYPHFFVQEQAATTQP